MLHNDGRCYIWIPSFLTLSTLSAEAAATINAVHTALGLPGTNFTAGQTNPYILTLNDLDMGGAPFTRGVGAELACCGPIENKSFLSVQYIALITAFSGEVEGYPVWFELADPDAECPLSSTDPKETWAEWGQGATDEPREIGSSWYRSSLDYSNGGMPLLASAWVPLLATGQVILTTEQYQALNTPE